MDEQDELNGADRSIRLALISLRREEERLDALQARLDAVERYLDLLSRQIAELTGGDHRRRQRRGENTYQHPH